MAAEGVAVAGVRHSSAAHQSPACGTRGTGQRQQVDRRRRRAAGCCRRPRELTLSGAAATTSASRQGHRGPAPRTPRSATASSTARAGARAALQRRARAGAAAARRRRHHRKQARRGAAALRQLTALRWRRRPACDCVPPHAAAPLGLAPRLGECSSRQRHRRPGHEAVAAGRGTVRQRHCRAARPSAGSTSVAWGRKCPSNAPASLRGLETRG